MWRFRNYNRWLRFTIGIIMSFAVAISLWPLSFVFAEDEAEDSKPATEVNITNEEGPASDDAAAANADTSENLTGGGN